MPDGDASVRVSLPEIYEQVLSTNRKVDQLALTVEQMVAINRRLDSHAERLRKTEAQVAAQWLVVGIVITLVGAALVKAIIGG